MLTNAKLTASYYIKTPLYGTKFFHKYLKLKIFNFKIRKQFSRLIVLRSPKHFNVGKIQVLNAKTTILLTSKTYYYNF